MCVSPSRLADGETVACGQCRRCRENRMNDYVGRCVAEAMTADSSVSVTLTYAGDVLSSAFLTFSDVQKLLKRLRKHGYDVRYLFAGELGKLRGRAHWHGILFFRGEAPEFKFGKRVEWDFWPHGFSFFREASPSAYAYVCKYLQKDDGSPKRVRPSRYPPLGYEYFMDHADRLVKAGLPLRDFSYEFAGVGYRRKPGLRTYWLQGRMRELFVERYVESWRAYRGSDPIMTEPVEWWLDREAVVERDLDPWHLERHISLKRIEREKVAALRRREDLRGEPLGYLLLESGYLLTCYPSGAAELVGSGGCTWIEANEESENVVKRLRAVGLSASSYPKVRWWLHDMWSRSKSGPFIPA